MDTRKTASYSVRWDDIGRCKTGRFLRSSGSTGDSRLRPRATSIFVRNPEKSLQSIPAPYLSYGKMRSTAHPFGCTSECHLRRHRLPKLLTPIPAFRPQWYAQKGRTLAPCSPSVSSTHFWQSAPVSRRRSSLSAHRQISQNPRTIPALQQCTWRRGLSMRGWASPARRSASSAAARAGFPAGHRTR